MKISAYFPRVLQMKCAIKSFVKIVPLHCWTLEELKSVGSYIAKDNYQMKDFMGPQAIEKRYKRFGGIIRYVIPTSETFLERVTVKQDSVLKNAKTIDAFAPYANIEKSDDQKDNISHFILTYDVEYGDEYKKEMKVKEFSRFRMKIASEYVKNNLDVMSDKDLLVAIKSLNQGMLKIGYTWDPLLFEAVVYNTIVNGFYKWQVFDQKKTTWIDHDWGLTEKQIVDIHIKNDEFVEGGEKICVKNLKPGILYRPRLKNFPGADMFFVKEREADKKEVFAIQVTVSGKHATNNTAYEAYYKGLQLDPEKDAVTFYIVSSSTNAKGYANAITNGYWSYFIKPAKSEENPPKLHFVAVKTSTNFDVPIPDDQ